MPINTSRSAHLVVRLVKVPVHKAQLQVQQVDAEGILCRAAHNPVATCMDSGELLPALLATPPESTAMLAGCIQGADWHHALEVARAISRNVHRAMSIMGTEQSRLQLDAYQGASMHAQIIADRTRMILKALTEELRAVRAAVGEDDRAVRRLAAPLQLLLPREIGDIVV